MWSQFSIISVTLHLHCRRHLAGYCLWRFSVTFVAEFFHIFMPTEFLTGVNGIANVFANLCKLGKIKASKVRVESDHNHIHLPTCMFWSSKSEGPSGKERAFLKLPHYFRQNMNRKTILISWSSSVPLLIRKVRNTDTNKKSNA